MEKYRRICPNLRWTWKNPLGLALEQVFNDPQTSESFKEAVKAELLDLGYYNKRGFDAELPND